MTTDGSTGKSRTEGIAVPFIGWSHAAHQFRLLAARRAASGGGPLLIIAASTIERVMMARAWQKAAGASDKDLPVIDLDSCSPSDIPRRCIATTARPTPDKPKQLLPRHLDATGETKFRPIPADERNGEAIPATVAAPFALRVYLPPLSRRPVDVLAWLHYYNIRGLPQFGFQYEAITSRLIHEMLFDCPWKGDVDALAGYLQNAATSQRATSGVTRIQLLETDEELPHFLPEFDVRKEKLREAAQRVYSDVIIPFARLPDLAVRIFRWRAQLSLRASDDHAEGDLDPTEDTNPLGPDLHGELDSEWSAGWSAEAFCPLALPDFVRGWVFQGLRASEAQLREAAKRLQRHLVLGATVESLQSGLALKPESVEWTDANRHADSERGTPKRRKRARRSKPLSSLALTEKEAEAYRLYKKVGLSFAEAGKLMGCTPQNVFKRYQRALEKLKLAEAAARSVSAQALPTNEDGELLIGEDTSDDLE